LAAVKHIGESIYYAIGDSILADREIVLEAANHLMGQYLEVLETAQKDLGRSSTRNIITKAGKMKYALFFIDKKLKADKEIILAAVNRYGNYLKYADEKLRDDKEIALAAVSQTGEALKYVSKKLQNDKDVVLAALKQNSEAIQFVSKRLREDEDVLLLVDGKTDS